MARGKRGSRRGRSSKKAPAESDEDTPEAEIDETQSDDKVDEPMEIEEKKKLALSDVEETPPEKEIAKEKNEEDEEELIPEKTKHEEDEKKAEGPPAKKLKTDEKKKEAVTENGKAEEGEEDEESSSKMKANKEEGNEKKRSPELEKFWKAVTDDPSDFTGWTYLLQFVDSSADVEAAREAYDAFLYRYPYCYGYWKKYADFERKKGSKEDCMEVFERGMKAIPLSADLWIHYLNHVKTEFEAEFIRSQYERAIEACGREWRSDKLWDHYVKWEVSNKNFVKVVKLYDRIIRNPTQGLSHQFEMFKDFVKEHNPKDFLEPNDFIALRKEILEDAEDKKDKKESSKKGGSDDEKGDPPGGDDSKLKSDEETVDMREKVIFSRKKVFKETEEKVQARWEYENNIKRPYFHMKPLERGQLRNWSEYLDFEKENAKKGETKLSDVEILFERCLIACALYEEFWMKYIDWLSGREDSDQTERIREVYQRVCEHHLPNKIEIHIQWANFEERVGNPDKSAKILKKLEDRHPELMSVVIRRINLERRRNNLSAVHSLYKSCIEKGTSEQIKSEIAVKYARFLRLGLNDIEGAINVLDEAILKDDKNPKLYLQLLDIYLHAPQPLDMKKIIGVIDNALSKSDIHPKHIMLFSHRKVELLEDFGEDIKDLLKAQEEYAELAKKHRPAAEEAAAAILEEGSGIKTIEGRGVKKNGSSTPTSINSPAYNALHSSQYQQYGSRYSSHYYPNYSGYSAYYQGGYGGASYGSGY